MIIYYSELIARAKYNNETIFFIKTGFCRWRDPEVYSKKIMKQWGTRILMKFKCIPDRDTFGKPWENKTDVFQ